MTEKAEELRQTPVEFKRHAAHSRRVGTNLVSENIVGRKADDQQVRCRARAQLLVQDELFGKFQLVIVGEGSGTDDLIKAERLARFVLTVSRRGRAEGRSVAVFPLAVPVFFRTMAAVEIAHPFG